MSRWLLSAEPALRVRASMAWLGVALLSAATVVMLWLAYCGWAPWKGVLWWGGIVIGGATVMSLMVRLGITRQWRDPSITIAQIVWGISANASAYVLAGEAKGVVPGMLAVALLFAGLDLNARKIAWVSLYALVAYIVAIQATFWLGRDTDISLEVAYAAALLIMLSGCLLLSLRLHQLRTRLRRQHRALAEALAINRDLAIRDPLTGLINRRHMMELIQLEQRRCQRGARSMLLVQVDIDHFKHVNDTHGHAVGDRTLQMFARVVGGNIRSSDVLSRWGGEEFVILLTDARLEGALGMLERVRAAVAREVVEGVPGGLQITVSMGVAEHITGEPVHLTLERADKALYRAKREGRNRVVLGGTQAVQEGPAATLQALPS